MGDDNERIPVSVKAGVLTLREFSSVAHVEQQTIEEAVVNMLKRYGQAFVDRERETIRSDLAFFAGVWLEDYDDEQEGILADNDRHDTTRAGTELFYRDKNGEKQDAALHVEILGDDTMPWDLDLEAFAEITPAEQEAYLRRLDDAMLGK